jgi:acyl-CoA synthetase (AMP-forming)/AMP-acid ligase II
MSLISQVNALADLPRIVSSQYGSKFALMVNGKKATYRDFESRTSRIANALIRDGILPEDRIAILSRDCLDSIQLLFGAAKAKAVVVNINWRLTADEIAYILEDAKVKICFVDTDFTRLIPQIAKAARQLPSTILIPNGGSNSSSLDRWYERELDCCPQLSYNAADTVVQIYTSGTTGHPKGVQLPNLSFFAIAQEMERRGDRWIGWTDEAVTLLFGPTFHIGGLWWLVRGLALGSTNIVLAGFDPAAVLRTIEQYHVTKTCMVPAMMQVLLREPACQNTDFQSLDTIVYGGSPISTELLKRAMDVFQCEFCQIYGMTETGNMAVCLRPEHHKTGDDNRLRAAGIPLPGVEVQILDRDRYPVAVGDIGEIAIHSPARMVGYWQLPDVTQEVMVDEWIMTGDAGYRDEEGFIYVCDRLKDMIILAGENIYPAEIENVMRRHPDVVEVAVIGIPDDIWGEAIKAFVVRNPNSALRASELIQHIRVYLAEFKIPKSIDFVQELPRTASGKIMKRKLREKYWKGCSRLIN